MICTCNVTFILCIVEAIDFLQDIGERPLTCARQYKKTEEAVCQSSKGSYCTIERLYLFSVIVWGRGVCTVTVVGH